ncbi:hypothetical protein [Actinomadura kijaniata]|uniref:hypothetical protein n=1 Tax=Actinomadura kijaniata TaxID=46161 RepID=UPI00082B8C6C|nr:hypothetical protein [Actinomadura kijaniata]
MSALHVLAGGCEETLRLTLGRVGDPGPSEFRIVSDAPLGIALEQERDEIAEVLARAGST